jgi:hypothetical protein
VSDAPGGLDAAVLMIPIVGFLPGGDEGERAVAVEVHDDPRHLAVADVEQTGSLRPHLT